MRHVATDLERRLSDDPAQQEEPTMITTPTTAAAGLPELLSPEVVRDPLPLYRRLRDDYPLHYDPSVEAYLISRHSDVGAAYRNPVFTTRNYEWQLEPVFGRGLLQLEGAEHVRKRALVSGPFRGEGLRRWEPVVARLTAGIIDDVVERATAELAAPLEAGMQIDLVADFAHRLPISVIAEVLDLPRQDRPRFFGWYTAMIAFLANLAKDPTVHENGLRARHELREYLAPVIRARRENPGDDLISALLTARIDGEGLPDDEVMTHVTQLLNAGAETTDKTIGSIVRHLIEHPDQFHAVREDRSLVINAISETLRLTPPSQMNGRVTSEEVEIAGGTVPAGAFVMLLIQSANRDARRFANPDRFDIFRTDLDHSKSFSGSADHFAFGGGRHYCLGAMLAKTEMEIALNMLFDRFPSMRFADGFVSVDTGLKMRAPAELQVVL
jgi:cytochrome P450